MKDFAHLHVHSEYSLLDGANKIDDLAKAASKDNQKALALTDHGNMYGALEFYNTCKKYDIKPIIGCELYVAKHSHIKKHSRSNGYNHLTLLAYSNEGLQNLMYLSSLSFIEGLSSRPRVSLEVLSSRSKGIICLSGCVSSLVNEMILDSNEESAFSTATTLRDIFGREHFWLEVQRNGLVIQSKATEGIVRLHKRTDIPLVATNDIHYLRHEDCEFQDTMLCINTGARKADSDRFRFDSDALYFKSRVEMSSMFRDLEESILNTVIIADLVDLKIDQQQHFFPESGYKNPTQELTVRTKQELSKRKLSQEYSSRLQMELNVINTLGFSEYFLVVEDLVRFARKNGIPVGPGRGSAAGCLVSYLLGITSLDPIQYGLLFERFLNSERKSLPDIDIDFCQQNRKVVIDYLKDKYGDDKVASIITFNRFGARKAIRQVARVLDVPLQESDTIAKKLTTDSIEENFSTDKTLADDRIKFPELFKTATNLEGYVEYVGVHASGVIISSKPLYEIVPLARIAKGSGAESTVVTQWDLEACEKVGLVKFDILGLETLTIISNIEKLVKARHNKDLYLTSNKTSHLKLDHPEVYQLLQNSDTEGVFQCYSDGMKRLLHDMKPDCFEDIVAAIALFRPGPLESGIAESFIKRKHGLEPVTYTHDDLKAVMGTTYGTMVYQEQIMQLASVLAGFSLNEADELRKAVGKKLPELLAKIEDKFIRGCIALGKVSKEVAQDIWQQIDKFGRYGFNKSHSVCYGWLTYYTAYLKIKYPVEFFCANLTQEIGNIDKMKAFISDAKNHGIKVIAPCLKEGSNDFTVVDDSTIRIGFRAIKKLGSLTLIKDNTDSGSELHLIPYLSRNSLSSKSKLQLLAQAGALDSWGFSRSSIIDSIDGLVCAVKDYTKEQNSSAGPLFGSEATILWNPKYIEDTKDSLMQMEREVFDFYISAHPLDAYRTKLNALNILTPSNVNNIKDPEHARLCGIITNIEVKGVKSGGNKGKKFARVLLEDGKDNIVCMFFTYVYGLYGNLLTEVLESAVPVVLLGKIEKTTDHPQMMVKAVHKLEEYILKSSRISVDGSNLTEKKLDILGKIMTDNPGPAVVDIKINDLVLEAKDTIKLTDDIIKQISNL
jgi:DNA polymerase-3 subunit alpha